LKIVYVAEGCCNGRDRDSKLLPATLLPILLVLLMPTLVALAPRARPDKNAAETAKHVPVRARAYSSPNSKREDSPSNCCGFIHALSVASVTASIAASTTRPVPQASSLSF